MNSAQKHFLLTIGSVFIGIVITLVCGFAMWEETFGLLHIFGLWFGGAIIAAALMDYMTSLSEYKEVEEYTV